MLAVTGTEALYADMGHFGATPIRLAWLLFVLPGAACSIISARARCCSPNPAAIKNPFYLLAPQWALFPLVVLATCATVIASQAVISGAFSLTRAAIQLGYCPRLKILHTSERQIGQIYVPFINWTLFIAVVAAGARASGARDNLGGAYGIAVTLAMLIDSVLDLRRDAPAVALAAGSSRSRSRCRCSLIDVVVPRVELAQDPRRRLVPAR